MRNKITTLTIVFFLLFPSILYAGSWEGKIVGISDGDIIKVLKNDQQVRVRLAAIDCPDKGQPFGNKAKQFTADMVAGKTV